MEAEVLAALAGGGFGLVASVVAAVVSVHLARAESRRLDARSRSETQRAADALRVEMQQRGLDFTAKLVEERIRTYPPVFELLGRVPDWAQATLPQLPEIELATQLHKHLYGRAGLLMSFGSRNAMIEAISAVVKKKGRRDAFYVARRYLRADLQLVDVPSVKGEVQQAIAALHSADHSSS